MKTLDETTTLAHGPSFIGRGWSYPVAPNTVGGTGIVGGSDKIEQAIYLILATTPGERPMRAEFGCGLIDYIFASLEPATFGRIAAEVENAIKRWEPRVDLHGVDVVPDPDPTASCTSRSRTRSVTRTTAEIWSSRST